jgi:aminoglycoside phosphotransferase (APT) family kinase protein
VVVDHSSRRFPLVEVTRDQLTAVLSPLLNGRGIDSIQHVEEGLTNTILRVSVAGSTPDLLVRICAGGRAFWDKERRLLTRLPSSLSAPTVLLADEGQGALPYPSLVYEWIGGINLNAMRRVASSEELLSLAAPLGRVLASISKIEPDEGDFGVRGQPPPSSPEALLTLTQHRLLRGRARARLGGGTADALWKYVLSETGRLTALGSARCLVHGDLGGRNILVATDGAERWRISGIVDWEDAFTGWALWDVGSLFRYPRRYSQAFRDQFERGYKTSGGMLAEEWWSLARLLDATRQVATLDVEGEMPAAFVDCHELLEAILHDVA